MTAEGPGRAGKAMRVTFRPATQFLVQASIDQRDERLVERLHPGKHLALEPHPQRLQLGGNPEGGLRVFGPFRGIVRGTVRRAHLTNRALLPPGSRAAWDRRA